MPDQPKTNIRLSYHGRVRGAIYCGTFGRRKTPVYLLSTGSSKAIVKAGSSRVIRGGDSFLVAESVLTHAGTAASEGQFLRNFTKVSWDGPGARDAKDWASAQCLAHAKTARERAARRRCTADLAASSRAQPDAAHWTELAERADRQAAGFEGWALDLAVPDPVDDDTTAVDLEVPLDAEHATFREAVLAAQDAVAAVPVGKGWTDHPATGTYMRLLKRAADREDTPPRARLDLDDLYGDVMVSRHPAESGVEHYGRLGLIAGAQPPLTEAEFEQMRDDYAEGDPGGFEAADDGLCRRCCGTDPVHNDPDCCVCAETSKK